MDTVLEQLPAFTRKTLMQHVRSISFIDGIPEKGVTSLDEGTTVPIFDIVLRAGLLKRPSPTTSLARSGSTTLQALRTPA